MATVSLTVITTAIFDLGAEGFYGVGFGLAVATGGVLIAAMVAERQSAEEIADDLPQDETPAPRALDPSTALAEANRRLEVGRLIQAQLLRLALAERQLVENIRRRRRTPQSARQALSSARNLLEQASRVNAVEGHGDEARHLVTQARVEIVRAKNQMRFRSAQASREEVGPRQPR